MIPKRVLLSSDNRNISQFPDSSKYKLNLGENLRNVSEIHLISGTIPNTVFNINKYAKALELHAERTTAPAGSSTTGTYFAVLPEGVYSVGESVDPSLNVTEPVFSITDAFNLCMTNSAFTIGGINDMVNISPSDIANITDSRVYAAPGTALATTTPDNFRNFFINEFNNLENKCHFTVTAPDPGQFETISILRNPVNLNGYSCDDVYGIPAQPTLSVNTFGSSYSQIDSINLFPIDGFYLRLGDGEGNYFNNIEVLKSDANYDMYGGGVERGKGFFAYVPNDSPIGTPIYFHPNGEHYAKKVFRAPIPNLSKLQVEWYQMRNKELVPLPFNNTVNTLLLDIYHAGDRPNGRR